MVTPGTTLDARWRLDELLAVGSMGEVFRGTDLLDGSGCAVKVLRAEFIDDGVQVQRFEREARTTLSLRHPNVVTVHASGVLGDRPWIAMELLEGESLERRLERGALSRADTLAVVRQVAAALDDAHGRGVIHRDLKPDNVFVLAGEPLRVKVLDFGFAKVTDRMLMDGLRTAADTLLGTPLYMAPEQIRSSRDVDHRADLWSLAVMAYELLLGEAPFRQRKIADLFVEILTAPIAPPTQVRAEMPAALDAWAAVALHRDPERRYQSAGRLAEGLANALEGRAPSNLPPAPLPAARRWGRVAAFAAAAVVVAAALVALARAAAVLAMPLPGSGF
ncbi:MAG: serine/threonine-protein kinase [Polyangiales bacterium]